ncbi:hypothetical protein JTB14_018843 [Gonioctena quinquepunctata]|nr:hypothetical protein JTB14_018843 [Gonioctena quinquepunctata]
MFPENVYSSFLIGSNLDYTLFKTAISFAESGLSVWFISPLPFDKVPENIDPPDKDILKLITFVYLKDYKSLISHLNTIHLWHKVPNLIILSRFDIYSNLHKEEKEYNPQISALISTSLLDCGSVCAKKKQLPAYLLATAEGASEDSKERLQVLNDMYFPHIIHDTCDNDLFKSVIEYYNMKIKK